MSNGKSSKRKKEPWWAKEARSAKREVESWPAWMRNTKIGSDKYVKR